MFVLLNLKHTYFHQLQGRTDEFRADGLWKAVPKAILTGTDVSSARNF